MGDVPVLVRFGWWISKALVIACGVIGVAFVLWRRRAAERRQIELERAARTGGTGLATGPATLQGTLRGRAVTATSDTGGMISDRSDELVLDVQGERVVLKGPVVVVRGTQAAASWRGVPALVPAAAAKGAVRNNWCAAAISDGDEVIAAGKLAHESGEAGDYRASGGEWVMTSAGDESGIDVWATSPAIVPRALHPMRLATYAAIWALGGYFLLWGLGATLVGNDREARGDHLATSLVIASALPHVRREAISALRNQADDELPRTEQNVRTYVELVGLDEGCAARAHAMNREELYEEAVAAARACGSVDEQIDALVHLGRYADAAALLPKVKDAAGTIAIVSIGAGKWAETARAARLMVERTTADQSVRYQCLDAYFSTKAGDAAAAKRLASIETANDTCVVVKALVLPEPQRQQALTTIARDPDAGSMLASELLWIDVPTDDPYMSLYVSDDVLLGELSVSDYPWLAQLAHRTPDAPDLPFVTAQHAIFTWVRGDVQGALAELSGAKQKLGADDLAMASELDRLTATMMLHTATAPIPLPIPAKPTAGLGARPAFALRSGYVPADAHLLSFDDDDQLRPALEAAIHGDGRPLAHYIENSRPLFDADVGAVLAVVPFVREHRVELAAALRTFHERYGTSVERLPFAQLADAAMRRDLAHLAGDDDSARRWQKLVDAQLAVIADRDKLTAFLLWHD
jgi:hypothetical protein